MLFSLSIVFLMPFVHASSEPWGTLKKARSTYPEIFTPGIVLQMKIDGGIYYVVCSSAERSFKKQSDESDQDLIAETELFAKGVLLKFLSEGQDDTTLELTMSGFKKLYEWREENIYYALFAVPVKNVLLQKKNVVPTVAALPQVKIVPPSSTPETEIKGGTDLSSEKKEPQLNEDQLKKDAENYYQKRDYHNAYIKYKELLDSQAKKSLPHTEKYLWRAAQSAEKCDNIDNALAYYKMLEGEDFFFSKYRPKAQEKVKELSSKNK